MLRSHTFCPGGYDTEGSAVDDGLDVNVGPGADGVEASDSQPPFVAIGRVSHRYHSSVVGVWIISYSHTALS